MAITVLAIIGRILLIILLVIIALALIVLFVPVRYQAAADSERKTAAAKISALLGLIRLKAAWADNETELGLYLLWFRLPFFKKNEPAEEDEVPEKTEEPPKSAAERIRDRIPFLSDRKKAEGAEGEAAPKQGRPRPHIFREVDEEEEERREALREEKQVKRERILRVVEYFFDRDIFDAVFQPLQKLLFRIRPRKCRGEAVFGLEDPSYTGYLCGALSMLPVLYETDLELVPDFETEKTYFQGHIWLCGRILTIFVLVFLLRLLLNKDFRRFFGMVRKLIKGEKKHG